MLGQVVWQGVSGTLAAGMHQVEFSAEGLSTGVYIYRLYVDGSPAQSRKMLLLK
jgi:hypothetical protein